MDQDDIKALASLCLVAQLSSGNVDPNAMTEVVAQSFDWAEEFAVQVKRRAALYGEARG